MLVSPPVPAPRGAPAGVGLLTSFECGVDVREVRRGEIGTGFRQAHDVAGTNPAVPPMGMRARLKADFDTTPFPSEVRVILDALKKYGMFVADNGSGWYVSGAPDSRWDDDRLGALKTVRSTAFEVVQMEGLVTP